jgi:hypothetical protein
MRAQFRTNPAGHPKVPNVASYSFVGCRDSQNQYSVLAAQVHQASITVFRLLGLKILASRFFLPQSRDSAPLMKNAGFSEETPALKLSASWA